MDRTLIDASSDLYATPWTMFWHITLPQIFPAILAGFLLSFTFSFDEFIIAFFVAGSETTLPIYVFSSIRRWVTPEVNAIGTYGANSISGFAWHTVSPSLSRRARFEKSTLRDCARNLDSSHYMWKTLAGLSVLLGSCFRRNDEY